MSKVIDLFLEYVKTDTQSQEESTTTPSTAKQHNLAKKLVDRLTEIGAEEITYDEEHCYVYATIPATKGCEDKPVLGFIAHMDTSPAVSGANVNPRIVKNYDGGNIVLNAEKNVVMKPAEFTSLNLYVGDDLIVTDGTTLLGADDKAGIAEIMAMAEVLLGKTVVQDCGEIAQRTGTVNAQSEFPHGKIRIGFTPDEEIGAGADYFDVKLFGADFAYTVDGGRIGELEYENFNAASARVTVQGRSVHPGDAKNKMKNAILILQEFQSVLPEWESPMHTEGYEGFYHLESMSGTVEQAVGDYIIRDHSKEEFEYKKRHFKNQAEILNIKHGAGTITVDMKDSYYNMREVIEQHMHLIDNAKEAMEELGIEPIVQPIRGGTDGARLSFMGLPCPNLGTGSHNCHGKYEYASVQSMEKIVELLVKIAGKYAE